MNDYLNQTITSICESIGFDSSLSAPQEGMPFGKGTADCLAHFLTLAERLGFETKNYDNYVGEVLFGSGTPFAVLAHLDVVPAGQGWNTPPFEGVLKDGKIFGRGAMDDKGPAIAALYAMKMLKDEGFLPKKQIKLIVGCNEESGWACIDHYKKVAAMPEAGFSPDANFPVIYAEKGIYHVQLDFPLENAPFLSFEGGERVNMVCDHCASMPKTLDENKAKSLNLSVEHGRLVSRGKSAHGSTPDEGINAIAPLLRYYLDDERIAAVYALLFEDRCGLKKLNDETGYLTLSPDLVKYHEGFLTFTCDIRYPASLSLDTVQEKIRQFGVPFRTASHQPPLYHEKDSELVQTLCDIYSEFSGVKSEPIAIGGGTYARALKMGVAFGPEIDGEEVTIHQANEYITIDRVELMLNVYKKALFELTK